MNNFKRVYNLLIFFLYTVSIITIIVGIVKRNEFLITQSVLIIFTVFLAQILEEKTNLHMPYTVLPFILIFIFFAMYLGKILDFYDIFPDWDKFLHTTSGILLVFVGYCYYIKLSGYEKPTLNHSLLIFWFCLMFAIAGMAVWEIFEFTTDQLFGLLSQKNSLSDTMWDIICGSSGGLLSCLYLLRYLKAGKSQYYNIITNEIQQTDKSV